MACLYTALLDAGDRLADAFVQGDADAAQTAIDERARLLTQRPDGVPSPELTERFRLQSERIAWALEQQRAELTAAVAQDSRAAQAHVRYRHAERMPALDTAPR